MQRKMTPPSKRKKEKKRKKEEILPPAPTWVDLEGIVLREVSQAEKDKFQNFTCPWNLKKQTHEQTRNRLIDTEIMLMVARWEGGWGLGEKGGGIQYKSEVTQ